jgi:hypothetical protein
MANLITPITLIPRNALTGVASDYSGNNPITVVIGNNTTEDLYFRGTYYKRPSETYIGLDINKYIKDLCKLDAVKPYQTTSENEITDFIKLYRVKMYDSSNTEIFDFTGYVFAGAPMLGDILRVFDGLFVGAYREYMEGVTSGTFLYNNFLGGVIADVGWNVVKDAEISVDQTAGPYSMTKSAGPEKSIQLFLDDTFTSSVSYNVTILIYRSISAFTISLFGVDISSQVKMYVTAITVQVQGTIDTATVPFLEITFPNDTYPQGVYLYRVDIQAYQATWENGTQYDLLLHNRIYTFDKLDNKSLTGVTWNKALIGAPVGISLWNPTDNDRALKSFVEYYKADLTVDKTQALPITYPVFAAKKTYGLFQNDNTYKRSAFRFALDDQTDVRAVFIERITPCFERNYYQVYYINRLGGLDWLIMTGKNYRRTKNEKKAYQIDNGEFSGGVFQYSTANLTKKNYLIEGKEIFELNSDIENESDYKWLEELVSSPSVWIWDYNSKLLQAVEVADDNFEFKNHWNNQVFNFRMNCETLNNSFR